MMRILWFGICSLVFLASAALAEYNKNARLFKVSVVNLTKGQPLTNPVVAVHAPGYKIVDLGQPASKGLSALAQDGVTTAFEDELAKDRHVVRSKTGKSVVLPGQSSSIILEANNPHFQFSVFSMLARTNDAFTAAMNLGADLKVGQKVSYEASVYDAGAEENTELCDHIPAPPCNNPMVGTDGGEGFVRPHEGLLIVGDLTARRDAFAHIAAKITIERIQ